MGETQMINSLESKKKQRRMKRERDAGKRRMDNMGKQTKLDHFINGGISYLFNRPAKNFGTKGKRQKEDERKGTEKKFGVGRGVPENN